MTYIYEYLYDFIIRIHIPPQEFIHYHLLARAHI